MNQASPKLFLYSLLLPIIWLSVGALLSVAFPDINLGMMGLVLILYLVLSIICWHFTKLFNRDFSRNEKARLTIYFIIWTVLCEALAIYSISESISSDALLITLSITFVIDSIFMTLGVHFISKRMNKYFLNKQPLKNA